MQSPFEIFRKHQKMLTVVLTGLAMFAFVILGAVPDPSAMPPVLGAIFIGGIVGGLAWLAGIRSKKSNEWGLFGFIAGLGIGLAAMMAVGPGDVVRADTGNIDQMQMDDLYRQRSLANSFVGMASARAQEKGFQAFSAPFNFGFGHPEESRDIVVGELLRREADRIGMQVTDEAVNDFIRSEFDGKIGAGDVREIRRQIGVSESELYTALRNELKASNAGRFFYGGITVANGRNPLPPLEYWEFYRRMNIQQSVGIVALPVASFVDDSATPSDSELQELFAKHKANFPNTTLEGRLEEGLIGFRQPRRVALEYIEIPYEAVEKTVGEVTDEEIEQHYEEFYASAPDFPMSDTDRAAPADGPMLPELTPDVPSTTDEKPEAGKAADEKPADDKPAEPSADQPAETPQEPNSETTPETPQPPAEQPNADEPPAEPKADDSEPAADESGASVRSRSALQLVAFFDDAQPAEQPEQAPADEPAAEQPPAEQPADKTDTPTEKNAAERSPADEAPADDKPAEEKPEAADKPAADASDKPAADAPASEADMPPAEPDAPAAGEATPAETPATPPAEPAGPRELDDELRAEIREQILRRKTSQKQQELMRQTFERMGLELSTGVTAPEGDPARVSAEETTAKLKEYARQNGLVYARTPQMTLRELEQSEEHRVGRAISVANIQASESAAQIAFSMPPSSLFQARQVMDIETGSRFVFWKVEDVPAYVPENLDDPGIREQVVKAWQQLQARENARARAQELAKQADGVDKPLSEIFAEATVTGQDGADAISVVQPPRFSWLSAPSAEMSPNPFNRPMPTMTALRTVPGDVGEEFMRTVFDRLDPGEAGVAHSYDMEYFYVVKILERSYGNSPDQQAFRERFITQPVFDQFGFSDYFKLAARELAQYQTNWADELFRRHNVVFAQTGPEDGEAS
jgi:hypothetical protein